MISVLAFFAGLITGVAVVYVVIPFLLARFFVEQG